MSDRSSGPIVFLDFDGTIVDRDVVDAILECFADPRWLAFEREWQAGRIGSRECLAAQMALVEATPAQIGALLADIEVDPGFLPLLDTCARHALPVHIVSDGFDYCIERILARVPASAGALIDPIVVRSSHLEPGGSAGWRTSFSCPPAPCEHGCATCKPAAMRALNAGQLPSLFVGDGLSDRYAAAAADIVFAKSGLARHCREAHIPYFDYRDLSAVATFLDEGCRVGQWDRFVPVTAQADAKETA